MAEKKRSTQSTAVRESHPWAERWLQDGHVEGSFGAGALNRYR